MAMGIYFGCANTHSDVPDNMSINVNTATGVLLNPNVRVSV